MYGLEKKLYFQLCKLRDEFNLQGIKAEFEAEGSSFKDLVRLRRLTDKAGIKLYIKIGGVEAIRDIKESIELGVDGIIAPMVESKFGAKKFYEAIKKYYKENKIHTTLNLETKNAIDDIDEILEYANNKFDNITIGRSDLSKSYFDENITPNSEFLFQKIENISKKIQNYNLTLTMGGSVNSDTIKLLNNYPFLKSTLLKLETRKVILLTNNFTNEALKEALKFEELYILSKKEISDIYINEEISRLIELKRRLR